MPTSIERPASFKKIDLSCTPSALYRALRGTGPGVLLESARVSPRLGRWSLVSARPRAVLRWQNGKTTFGPPGRPAKTLGADPFDALQKLLRERRTARTDGAPPFAGGAVGFVGYEAKAFIEPALTRYAREDLGLPWMYFLFLNEGVLFDHTSGETLLFAADGGRTALGALEKKVHRALRTTLSWNFEKKAAVRSPRLECSVSRRKFIAMVMKAKEHIRRGDIYQANLSQRFTFPLTSSADAVYERLKALNPSSFFGFLDAGDFQILSGSPERLLKLEGRRLETRPIAGTRPRGRGADKDRAVSLELLLSEKERAEHVMLLDLERNDLGRVAEYGSVAVDELMALEDYSHVKHIVSNVRAVLRDGLDAVDAFKAFFPGGTITGAPKVRSMQVIDALEPVARGPYTGSMGYFSFTGDMDFNIIIRSLVLQNGRAHLQVGAGIVADSDPEREYDETLHKAEAVLAAVFGPVPARGIIRRLRTS